ncbi:50S ribosomal protein L23 [Candidatus Falkowbacteria bacterium RIFOXYB2_FULL_47_14]|uniref:Large ribosomal subunit protein uL23 n=1 Tax=Candidatus Falkowbacteria bacterium RIFOXYA2_FULL_47_19 TaxID=1797994 RepID=A0A1F5SI82_9BACT|nr:MAG: 50S ribosomal protein L23 [Candidatus Falkowbacteria bacterium RIFOXYA2_FULL_47_19]OGF35466.1 MAG: 50S ribosomal protein L23 [Candidatus Falkowbacteria bacterium RIFOXYC2_FULL_46_15]OGF42582.1 MAG: 50S ribosomal protein L23 [Candidatus Falkowbacteria bacterium RIFOXYB2_FULL_47_14]
MIIRPLITEKAANLGAVNKYAFVVSDRANKIEVEKAVNELYGIKPTSVNMLKVLGKKTRRGRVTGRRKNWKKAIVTLPKGKSINIYEGV